MLMQAELGHFRVVAANMTAHQLATEARKRGCELSLSRLRRIESGETTTTVLEREMISEILKIPSCEVSI
jgi:hypothetical protein